MVNFDTLFTQHPWRAIPGCPGRFTLPPDTRSPTALLGDGAEVTRFETSGDPVHVAAIAGGGLISYERPDGRFIHTLNTPEGFRRKLAALGLVLPRPV